MSDLHLQFLEISGGSIFFRELRSEKERRVNIKTIMFFSASQNYVSTYLEGGGRLYFLKSISSLEDLLAKSRFVRVHRSYLVNFLFLDSLELKFRNAPIEEGYEGGSGGRVILHDKKDKQRLILPVGRRYRSTLRRFVKK